MADASETHDNAIRDDSCGMGSSGMYSEQKTQAPFLSTRSKSKSALDAEPPEEVRGERRKRPRGARSGTFTKRHFVTGFDEPFRLIEVKLDVLDTYACRTALSIARDKPTFTTDDGHGVWSLQYSHVAICTWLRAMLYGELQMDDPRLTYAEILKLLEYEGIDTPSNLVTVAKATCRLSNPRPSLAGGRHSNISNQIAEVAESVADGILAWPRLANQMDHILRGGEFRQSSSSAAIAAHVSCRCSGTRAWIGFPPKPTTWPWKFDERHDPVYELVHVHKPFWLQHTLRVFGAMLLDEGYDVLETDGEEDPRKPSPMKAALSDLTKVAKRAAQTRLVAYDGCENFNLKKAKAFADYVTQHVLAGGPTPLSKAVADVHSARVRFARACVSLADYVLRQKFCKWHALNAFFDNSCADEQGSTPERMALDRALKARRVSIVRWAQEAPGAGINRIVPVGLFQFPPVYDTIDASPSICPLPRVLVSFEEHY